MGNTNRAGLMYALAAAVGLGAITTQAKLVYEDGGNAPTLMFWRFLVSVLVIGLILLIKRQALTPSRHLFGPALLLGVVWSGAMIAYLMSVQFISVSVAVLILYSYPMIVLLVSILTGKLNASFGTISLFIAAFIGIALMLMNGEIHLSIYGLGFAVAAALGAAYTFLAGSRVAPKLNPNTLTLWVNLAGLLLIIPLVATQFQLPDTWQGIAALSGATACYVVAILCQFQALSQISAARASFIFNVEPVVSIVLALLVLNETLSAVQWLGVIVVLAVLFIFTKVLPSDHSDE